MTPRDFNTALNGATNACTIIAELTDGVRGYMDQVATAAAILDDLEHTGDFTWEDQTHDYESVCARIASHIQRTGDSPDIEEIRAFITAK